MTSLMRFGISGNTYAISGATLKGRRDENQDLFAWSVVSGGLIESCIGGDMLRSSAEGRPDMMLALVCDGLGGMRDGAAASRAVAEGLIRWFMTEGPSEDDPNGSLETAIIASDTWLGIRHSGSGTTRSAVMSIGSSWVSAHLGDSRCYRVSGRGVWRTRDQSPVEDLFRAGMITEDEMNTHPRSNVMDVCMGLGEARRTVFDDLGDDWDRLVLCSDGAFGYMGAEDFRTVLGASGSAEDIVDAAYERGSTDNITAVLIEKSRRA